MYTPPFTPSDWVYVNDPMGRLNQGHYKNKSNPHDTISVSEFEKRKTTSNGSQREQKKNIFQKTQTSDALSPWDNPMIGEQTATSSSQTPSRSPVSKAPAVDPAQPEPKKEANQKTSEEEDENRNDREGQSGRNSGRSVICTEMVRQNKMSESDARASTLYAHRVLGQAFLRGYRFWAIPYVRLMRKSKLATSFISVFVDHRTEEILFRLGRKPKGSKFGKIVCALHDPICMVIGNFVKDRDTAELYQDKLFNK